MSLFISRPLLRFLGFVLAYLTVFQVHSQIFDLAKSVEMKNTRVFKQNILTGGQPSASDLNILAKRGLKRIINLRNHNEFDEYNEEALAKSLNIEYIHIPVAGAKGLTKDNIAAFSAAINASDELTLVHCASSNRVGALFALDAALNNKNKLEQSLKVGEKAGLGSLKSKVIKIIKGSDHP